MKKYDENKMINKLSGAGIISILEKIPQIDAVSLSSKDELNGCLKCNLDTGEIRKDEVLLLLFAEWMQYNGIHLTPKEQVKEFQKEYIRQRK